jgi:hypothetical protein
MARTAEQTAAVLLAAMPYRNEMRWRELTTADVQLLDRLRDRLLLHLLDLDRLRDLARRLGAGE